MTLREKVAEKFGKFIATSYAALCALGTTNKVALLLARTALGFAAGSLTFFANVAMFWIVVPKMFLKMSSKTYSVYDDSFELTTIGPDGTEKKSYQKLESNNKHLQIRGWRRWTINGFVYLFGSTAALVYTSLLLGGIKNTLSWIIPGVASMGTLPFLGILIPFALIGFGANWPFNTFDASEAFSKHDFIPKLKDRIKRWFWKDDDLDLKLDSEVSITKNQLYARKIMRALLFVSIFGLISMGIVSIGLIGIDHVFLATRFLATHMGAPYWTLFEPIAQIVLMTFNTIAMGYFTLGATARFSSVATRALLRFGNYYASIGDDYPKAKTFMHLTLIVPVSIVLGTTVRNLIGYLGYNILKAAGYKLNYSEEYLKERCAADFEKYKNIKMTAMQEMAQQTSNYGTVPASDDEHWGNYLKGLNPLKKAWKALDLLGLEEIHAKDYKKYLTENPQGNPDGFEKTLSKSKIAGSSAAALFYKFKPWNPSRHGTKVDVPELLVNYLVRPIAAIGVTIARFCVYSIDLIALGNALCNGALAHDGGNALSEKNLSSMVGQTLGSGECYVNAKVQEANVNSGDASTEQKAIPVKTLYFAHKTGDTTKYARYAEDSRIEQDNKPEVGSFVIDGALENDFVKRGFLTNP